MGWLRSHKLAVAVGVVAVVAWVAFGFFGVHTLLFDDEVDEAAPVFDSGAGPADEPQGPVASTQPSGPAVTTPPSGEPTVVQVASGSFVDRSHPATGRAVVLSDSSQTFLRFEDFETDNGPDLFVYLSRGVSADSPEEAFDDDFVNLGALKGNVGNQNYEVPAEVDIEEYSTVVIWCRQFSVAFGAAALT